MRNHFTSSIGLSFRDCMRRLQSYSDKIDYILSMFDEHGKIMTGKALMARDALKDLIGSLKLDYESRSTKRSRQKMTEFEKNYFFPAIHEAKTRIRVKSNSRPSAKWVNELLDVQLSIRHYLDQLEGQNKHDME